MSSAKNPSPEAAAERAAILVLLEKVFELTGLDFRQYSPASIQRRVQRCVDAEGATTVEGLRTLIADDSSSLQRLVEALTVPVTSMFRDPSFFREFRTQAVPLLRTHPFLRLWVAGCSTGEEVYSLAILLHEEGLYERSRIYATELQPAALAHATNGIYTLATMREYTQNYQESGGVADFSEYYAADSHAARIRPFLRENVVFATHNLVSDRSFNEFHVVFCRNVMIYFNRELQARVHNLFYESLVMYGYLGLGRSESVRFSNREECYEQKGSVRLYRKIR